MASEALRTPFAWVGFRVFITTSRPKKVCSARRVREPQKLNMPPDKYPAAPRAQNVSLKRPSAPVIVDLHWQPESANQNCCSIKGTPDLWQSRNRNVRARFRQFCGTHEARSRLRFDATPVRRRLPPRAKDSGLTAGE